MTPEIQAVFIGAGTTAVTGSVAWTVNTLFKRRDARAAARDAARDRDIKALQELLRAAREIGVAIEMWRAGWGNYATTLSAVFGALAELAAAFTEENPWPGFAAGLRGVRTWDQAHHAAERELLAGPVNRLMSAWLDVSASSDTALREAGRAVFNAVREVLRHANTAASRRKRRDAEKTLAAAMLAAEAAIRTALDL